MILPVEKPNKQGKVNPQHILNTTPSLNCCSEPHTSESNGDFSAKTTLNVHAQ